VRYARIEDVTEFVLDGTHGSPIRTEAGVPVLSAQNVKHGRLDFETDRYTSLAEYEQFRRRLAIRAGDVLLTIVGTIGRSAVVDSAIPAVLQRSVAVLRSKSDFIAPRFLYHATRSQAFQAQLSRGSNQSSQAGVYLGRLKELTVPLPALNEQRRIAAILDKADALRTKRRAALASTPSPNPSSSISLAIQPRHLHAIRFPSQIYWRFKRGSWTRTLRVSTDVIHSSHAIEKPSGSTRLRLIAKPFCSRGTMRQETIQLSNTAGNSTHISAPT
jgi:type I restriction enzyme S subunit